MGGFGRVELALEALTGGWQERKEVGKRRVCSGKKSGEASRRSVTKRQEGESGAQVDQVLPTRAAWKATPPLATCGGGDSGSRKSSLEAAIKV